MEIEYDPIKRAATLKARQLDMERAGKVFDGPHLTFEDDRQDYGEPRYITLGHLEGRMVVLAWTPRGTACRIMSMRKANERERDKYGPRLG